MAGRLVPVSVTAPGFMGLNTQEQAAILDIRWASRADNCVIDASGRIGARKGWTNVNTSAISGTPDVTAIHEYVDKGGSYTMLCAAGNAIYSGTSTLTDITGTLTPTADYWQFANFNGKVVCSQSGHTMGVWSGSGSFAPISAASGTVPSGNACLSAFGRVWAVSSNTDRTVVKYSALLDETNWSTGAGSIDLSTVWGGDEVVALAEFNGRLVIFGKHTVLVYANPWDVSTSFVLEDRISGIGCIARDSVQNLGTDVIFLSSSGLRTLSRTVNEPSMPVTDISRHVRDDLMTNILSVSADTIKSVYSEKEGFYLLSIPSADTTYCFDVRYKNNEDMTLKCTKWNTINPTALCYAHDQTLYMGQTGYLAEYTGYQDNGAAYTVYYKTAWFDMGEQWRDRYKIPKKLTTTLYSLGNKVLTYYWAYDFIESDSSVAASIVGSGSPDEWGVFEWGIGEWSGGATFAPFQTYLTGYGKVIRLGFAIAVDGANFAIQKLDFLAKVGRLN
jgi:hypothetical protein